MLVITPRSANFEVWRINNKLFVVQCSPMAVGPSDISCNDWLGPINSSPAADRMSDEIFGANLVFLAEI